MSDPFWENLLALCEKFRETAQSLDQSFEAPRDHLSRLASIGYFKFVCRAAPGERRRALDQLSSACGVTAFLATQHEGVCRRLHKAQHPLWERACQGDLFVGVCFAHLRRPQSPVEAIDFRHQVVFSGRGPWFSGYGLMDMVMVGGASPGGEHLMGLAPIDTPEIQIRQLPPLQVMNATATVGLDFNALAVPKSDIIVQSDAQEMVEKDMHSTIFQSARSLGAARAASLHLPEELRDGVENFLETFHCKLDSWDEKPNWKDAVSLRADALAFSQRVIEAAFVGTGGKAQSSSHPLQRISREARFYSTTQLTRPLKDQVLGSLREHMSPT